MLSIHQVDEGRWGHSTRQYAQGIGLQGMMVAGTPHMLCVALYLQLLLFIKEF